MVKNINYFHSILLLLLVFALQPISFAQNKEITDEVYQAIKIGDAQKLATFFNSTIDLNVPGSVGIYSKNQALQILKVFFKENSVTSFEIKFKGKSKDGSNYAIGELKSGNKTFRVYFLVKSNNSLYLIHQLQIETEE